MKTLSNKSRPVAARPRGKRLASEALRVQRDRIDAVDSNILGLLHERLEAVREIGLIKEGLAQVSWVPARERDVLRRLMEANRGIYPERALRRIFGEIFSISRQLERPIEVVYCGEPGSLTHAAALEQFGSSTRYRTAGSVEGVFDQVTALHADFGLVPIEVSHEGIVTHALEVFLRSDLRISAEYYLNLELVLAGRGPVSKIDTLYVQPQIHALVREWIGATFQRQPKIVLTADTVEAARACDKPRRSRGARATLGRKACIVPTFTARFHGLPLLAERVPYGPTQRLRFLSAGQQLPAATQADKTTIAFSLVDRVGVLAEALQPFQRHRLNLSFLQSYPASKASPTVTFFADILGHSSDEALGLAVNELRACCAFVKVLGSYPVFRVA